MSITKTTEISGIRYHLASTQPTIPVPESEDVMFVDTRTIYFDSGTGESHAKFESYRLTSRTDISEEPVKVQAIWNIIFGDSAQAQAQAAIAASAALAAATTST